MSDNHAEIETLRAQIAELKAQLNNIQTNSRALPMPMQRNPLEAELEVHKNHAHIHATRINELAEELASEIKELKAIADEITPGYWQLYYKPFITGFQTISLPYVRSDGEVWSIINRVV